MDDNLQKVLKTIDLLKTIDHDTLKNLSDSLLYELQDALMDTSSLIARQLLRTMPTIGPCPNGH